jgi:hypothetical protein
MPEVVVQCSEILLWVQEGPISNLVWETENFIIFLRTSENCDAGHKQLMTTQICIVSNPCVWQITQLEQIISSDVVK